MTATEQRPDRVVIYTDEAGGFRWRRLAPNGEIISSGESYTRLEDAREAAHRINGEDVEYVQEPRPR